MEEDIYKKFDICVKDYEQQLLNVKLIFFYNLKKKNIII